jgi:hypothetical protein
MLIIRVANDQDLGLQIVLDLQSKPMIMLDMYAEIVACGLFLSRENEF